VNVTADQVGTFQDGGNACNLVNSLFTSVTNTGHGSIGNCSYGFASSAGIYQTAGAGAYYLAAGSTNRNAGTTNIPSAMLADLQTKTTYPPVIVPAGWLTINTNFSPQAQRDTDIPDLGYHYDPLDYALDIAASNATINVLPGTALCMYGVNYGIWVYSTATLNCTGTATSPNYVVRYNTVQEQSNTNWESTSWEGCILAPGQEDTSSANFFFTDWSVLAGDYQLYSYSYPCYFGFQDCQFYGGEIYNSRVVRFSIPIQLSPVMFPIPNVPV
jgi:hypothetical protein